MKMPSFRIAVTLPLLLQAALAFQPLVFSGTRVSGSNSRLLATVVRNPEAEDAAKAAYALPPIPPNGKRLFLIRHGEVVNPGGSRKVFYGDMNVPLTLLGQKEACVAADYLSRSKLTAVYTSPLSRAFYGAQQVGARQQQQETLLTPIRLQGLSELKRGAWRGKTKDEIGEEQLARFDACDLSVTPARGESFPALHQRVTAALYDTILPSVPTGESAAIVSHLQVTRCLVAEALGVPLESMTQEIAIQTASITCIDYVNHVVPQQIVRFQSFKPEAGLPGSQDGAN